MIVLFNDSPNPPTRSLGIYRIATALRQHGAEVEVIDFLSHWKFESLLAYLDSIPNVEWWGFSTKFFPPTYNSKTWAGMIKVRNNEFVYDNEGVGFISELDASKEVALIDYIKSRNGTIVVGGPNAEIAQFLPINVDIVCTGYSDLAVVKIHEHITTNNELIFKDSNNKKVVDADSSYPVTSMSGLTTTYVDNDFLDDDWVVPIEISRGCIFHCVFCEFDHLGKKAGTYIRPKEDIKQDILYRYNTFGITKFLFVDDTFNDSLSKMQLIKEIRQETGIDFEFWSYCRLDLLAANPDQVDLIPEIGWRSFTIGLETFNRDSGKAVGKGADPEKLKQFLIALKTRFPELRLQINIIVGLPHDTEETIKETVQWFIDNPNVGELVKLNTLRIKNPTNLTKTVSKLSKNPEKYGYEILGGEPYDTYSWKTQHLDNVSAQALVDKYQYMANPERKTLDHVSSLTDQQIMIKTPDGKMINTKYSIIENYIVQKLHYRQVQVD